MQTTHHTPTVMAYARSLLELAEQEDISDTIGSELDQLGEVLTENPVFVQFLADPGISQDHRARVLHETFKGKISPLLFNFIGVLNLKGRLKHLADIISAYSDLMDEKHGKVEVDVTTAHRLSEDELLTVRQKVSSALKRDAVLHQYVDESIIGGIILRVQDKMIDGSVKQQIKSIRQRMINGVRS